MILSDIVGVVSSKWGVEVVKWPLAVGRWPLAVGRWPIAVGCLRRRGGRAGALWVYAGSGAYGHAYPLAHSDAFAGADDIAAAVAVALP